MTARAEVLARLLSGNERIAVTGATGWLGGAVIDLLAEALGAEVAAEQVHAYGATARTIRTASGRPLTVQTLADLQDQDPAPTHLVHLAFLTRDRVDGMRHADYVSANLAITTAVLAAVARHKPRGVAVASSGAVYALDGSLDTDLKYNPYGVLKHLDELAFRSACDDVDAGFVVPRIFSVAGSGITKAEKYALGSLIAMAQAGGPLDVRATGQVVRSYADVRDVAAVTLGLCLSGDSATFDTGGEVLEVGELAHVVARVHGLPTSAVRRDLDPDAAPDRYVGDPTAWGALIRRFGIRPTGIDALVEATAASMTRAKSVQTGRVDLPTTHVQPGGPS